MGGKRLLFTAALILAVIFSLSGVCKIEPGPEYTPKMGTKESSSSYSAMSVAFSVLGDIHCNTGKLEKAIKDLYGINPHADAMVLNGDIVDQGLDKQYSKILACLDKNKALLPGTVIKNIGNHEFFDYSKGPNSPLMVNGYISRYLAFSREKKVYHDVWIKGYHFISLGSEQCNTEKLGNTQAFISEEQQKWLGEKLREKYAPGKPVFVFLHQHIADNTKIKVLPSSDIKQAGAIKAILSRYPEVILFTSHTHSFLKSGNLICSYGPFTAVHTGAVNNPIALDGSGRRFIAKESQGLYVEVKKNKITIKGRNFDGGQWVQGVVYSKDFTTP